MLAHALRHRPQHRRRGGRPAGALARPAGAALLRPGARRLERHRLRRPGLPEALPVRDRLADRPGAPQRAPADGAAGQGRLLGRRDQARPGRRAGRLSGLHAQGPHRRLLPRLRAQAAGGARRGLPAVRHPQRADAGGDPRHGGRLQGAVRVPVPARHGRDALRRGGRAGEARPACRIYAPVGTHETLLAYLVRRLLENGANTSFVNRIADPAVPIDELVADPVEQRAAPRAGRRAARAGSRCRATCSATSAPIRRASTCPTSSALRRCERAHARRAWSAGADAGRRRARRRGARVRNPADHGDIVGTVVEATPEVVDAACARGDAVDGRAAERARDCLRARRRSRWRSRCRR